jgi:RNA polymerase sigma-70 factor (ECF subfamily)
MFEADFDFIWRSLRRLGLDEAAADDAAQETFVVAAKKLEKIDLGRERSFLLSTAVRLAANVRRSRAYRDRREAAAAAPPPPPDESSKEIVSIAPLPDEQAAQRQQLARLDEALSNLPDDLREVIVLTELEALPQPEIASLLNLPLGTVASRLRRARRDLANAMAQFDRGDQGGDS